MESQKAFDKILNSFIFLAQAAIKQNTIKLGPLNNRNFFLMVHEDGKSKIKVLQD